MFYDDEPNTDRVQVLYAHLIIEDNANFLISPNSSDLAGASAMMAAHLPSVAALWQRGRQCEVEIGRLGIPMYG